MSLEYAPRGLIGVLTPQANPTVEPEFGILLPAGMGMLAARMVSNQPSVDRRLADYFNNLDQSVAQFGDAPLSAIGVACTGSSYIMGREHEALLFGELSQRKGIHVTSSALAVVDALRALQAQRIGLVSPYSDGLLDSSIQYWQSHGLNVQAVSKVELSPTASGSAQPIYAIGSKSVMEAMDQLRGPSLDAIVMLGTGMPSLRSILHQPSLDGAPVISCTLALAWRCACALEKEDMSLQSLRHWIAGTHWNGRMVR
jgi:maleate cis-trans isomerase